MVTVSSTRGLRSSQLILFDLIGKGGYFFLFRIGDFLPRASFQLILFDLIGKGFLRYHRTIAQCFQLILFDIIGKDGDKGEITVLFPTNPI